MPNDTQGEWPPSLVHMDGNAHGNEQRELRVEDDGKNARMAMMSRCTEDPLGALTRQDDGIARANDIPRKGQA